MKLLLFTCLFISASAKYMLALKHNPKGVQYLTERLYDISNPRSANYGNYMEPNEIISFLHQESNVMQFLNEHECVDKIDAVVCKTIPHGFKHPDVVFIEGPGFHQNEVKSKPSRHHVSAVPDAGFVGRESLVKLYNVTTNLISESICAVEYIGQYGFTNDDFTASEFGNNEPLNNVSVVVGDNTYPDTESSLDLQMESQMSPGAKIWFWGSPNWLYTWAVDMFNTDVIPWVTSHSWGWASDQQCTIDTCNSSEIYVYRVNIEYLKLALRGVTIVAASGDSGAPGRSNEMCQDPDVNRNVMPIFPGSSPFVLSAGATYVVSNGVNKTDWKTPLCQQNGCTTGTTQAPIMFPDVYWTAGGGFSIYSSRQSWQDVAVQSYMSQNLSMPTVYNKNGRAYPDVAVVGHNCPTWIEGSLIQVDGTSCSSPILASMIAIMNDFQVQRGQPRLGLVAPLLYDMYNSDPSIFTDITEGFNWCTESLCCPTRADGGSDYGYLAGTGFDPVTGLGTPNLGKMLTYLETFRK